MYKWGQAGFGVANEKIMPQFLEYKNIILFSVL